MKAKLAVLVAMLVGSGAVMAQAASAPEPDYTLSFNVGAVTDYRYRGISQSRLRPALQGGADFAHKSGFYVGTWGSTIKWIKDAGGDANIEVDLYAGYKTTFSGVGVDVGVLRYFYPGSDLSPATGLVNPDTTEVYLAGTLGPATLKYSHSTTDLFGTPDSKGSGYLDLSAAFELPWYGLTLTPHIGHQRVRHNSAFSYTDWSLTLGKDFGNGFSASLAYVDTNIVVRAPNGKDNARGGVVAGVKYAF
ncbi:TorF family putative porin [Ramlibacter alkalitolerans]|jgi:uncharacterized protein (TIGR02001 family)|uniref:Uncharacterized protein n=1 Tax=Ramlibacter alkalitolerans TaxID=2039631 RepID=A0ABS1JS05_9BURK|nr:TorF family putative porin [Ramlibacter alkalitolerans]MBL0427027.1 hypothetical protein [Ramlibacter alkalitolerans]